jgi:hypothetical protein
MREAVVAFLDTHANLNLGNLEKMSAFLEGISNWKFNDISSATREIYNMVYNVSKVYPNKTLARKFQYVVPDHWTFSLAHSVYLQEATKAFYSNIAAIGGDDLDATFSRYLTAVVANLTDLVLFIEQIPVFSPLIRGEMKYWSLYNDETILLLYNYGLLSAVHEYVVLANDRAFVEMRAEEIKTTRRRGQNQEDELEDEQWIDNLDANEDYGAATQIRQVHIVESDAVELKKTAAKWLNAVLQRELDTKTAFNRDYKEIMDSTMSLKYKDKKGITDYLANLSRDERRVEQTLRSHKIGRWNVGMQKGLYQYEKNAYDAEITQWHTEEGEVSDAIRTALQSVGTGEEGEEVEDLERDERIQQEAEYDDGDGWEDLNEDYMDGIYYEEDAERGDYGEY